MGAEQHSNTKEVRPISRRRIEFDPEEHDSDTVELADAVRRLLAVQRDEQLLETVREAGAVERAARAVTGHALLAADGAIARRTLAEAYGRGGHDAINRRIAAAKHDTEHE